MSLDLFLKCGECGKEDHFNYTYNAAKMWYAMYPDSQRMVDIDDCSGKAVAGKLVHAILQMKEQETELRQLESENGWGSYDGFLDFLRELLSASLAYPKAVWRASR